MSTSNLHAERVQPDTTGPLQLEVVTLPVADVARAKAFYAALGWRLDAELARGEDFHLVQMTPPGSPCSIHFGRGITEAPPGSAQGLYLVVPKIEAARAALLARGAAVGEIYHGSPGDPPASGPEPTRRTYASYASFRDPDGNRWLLQEVTARLPGRLEAGALAFATPAQLASALRRAQAAHRAHEQRGGSNEGDWALWYAGHLWTEQQGAAQPA
ncbi:MAG TPA: VOC family protein [Ramlibacter sp.]|jgi:catechol 2,3-dioxygenase-like lactoylglutathione lyase family enzyme|nr:VOC family protein [Ramlibacter sp.]